MRSAVGMRIVTLTAAALLVTAPPLLADTWPLQAHDAANSSRSSTVSAQAPALLPGWPATGLPGAELLVGPRGPVLPGAPSYLLNRDGTLRATVPVARLTAIGPDGAGYAFRREGDVVAAYEPSGSLRWISEQVDLGSAASGRTIVPAPDGTVYVTGTDGVAALDGATGRLRWQHRAGFISDNVLVVRPDGAVVYTLDEVPGPLLVARTPDGAELWRVVTPGRVNDLAVRDDNVLIAVQDRTSPSGGTALRAFGADGAPLWSVPTGANAPGPVAVAADGTVYSVHNRDIVRDGVVATTGRLVAIAPDGTVRWELPGRWSPGRPLIGGDGLVYVAGSPLGAVRPTGRVAWRFPSRVALAPRAIGPDGTLYARPREGGWGTFFALAGPDAARAVRVPGPPAGPLVSALAVKATRIRSTGEVSLCTPAGRCAPTTPRTSTMRYRLSRDAVVNVLLRRASDGRVVARSDRRRPAGTNWMDVRDLLVVLRGPGGGIPALPAGRYLLTVRAAVGRQRVTTRPVRITVVGPVAAIPTG